MASTLILFAHGARDARWAEPFEAVSARVQALSPGREVRLAFLELMQPSLGEAVTGAVAAGATAIDVVPMFLGTGGHLRKDLPPLVEAARAAHPAIAIHLHPAIGEHTAVLDAMAQAAHALAKHGE